MPPHQRLTTSSVSIGRLPASGGVARHGPTHTTVLSPVHIGCSGWQYQHWRGDFYPTSVPQSRWLEFYADRFDTVEVNNTFYRLPEAPTFAAWARRAPSGFVYAVKASR